ncbi:MAG: hypothetical protein HPY54_15290, partial [Chthonomonadetes bacterium]|nr:hypothetical protein [Chthonomonadetes bacterium]
HVDANLRAAIAVSGQFNSLIVDEGRNLTLPVWVADFTPDEEVDFDQIVSRSFSQLELPEEPGWGLFAPAGNFMQLQVRLTDTLGRLGRVEFRDPETWQLIASLWANAQRTEVSGTFSIPWDRRELVAEVLNDTGRVLARLAVDVGKFDTVVPVIVRGSFEPYRVDPEYCDHASAEAGDAYGQRGHPYAAPGRESRLSLTASSWTTIYTDFTNDRPAADHVPPSILHELVRKRCIANTVDYGRYKVGDGQAVTNLQREVQSACQEETSPALTWMTVPPYSEGCAKWRVYHYGHATAVLAIPYERNKRNRGLTAFLAAVAAAISGERKFLSILVAALANEWLQDLRNQQASGLKPGEVLPWGDVYVVETREGTPRFHRLLNLTQEWRVFVRVRYPDGSTAPAEGVVQALIDSPRTNPAPPSSAVPDTYVGRDGATIRLGKGWRWKLKVSAPGGEERLVDVPNPDPNPTVTLYIQVATPPSQPPGGE